MIWKVLLTFGLLAVLSMTSQAQAQTATNSASLADLQANLVPTEFMACPETGESEWLEMFNNGPDTITAQDWTLEDEAGNTRSLSFTISSQSYQVVSWSGSLLNNSGDSLTLLNHQDEPIFSVSYDACTKGSSWAWNWTDWQEISPATPLAANPLTASPSPTPSPSPSPSYTPTSSPITYTATTPSTTPTARPQSSTSPAPTSQPTITPSQTEPDLSAYITKLNQSISKRIAGESQSNTILSTQSAEIATASASTTTQPALILEDPNQEYLEPDLRQAVISVILSGGLVAAAGLYMWREQYQQLKHQQDLASTLSQLATDQSNLVVDLDQSVPPSRSLG